MATLAATQPTLVDWAKRLDPDGKVPIVAELLSQTNEILTDAVFVQGNLPTGHRVVVRTGLPAIYWRTLNAGVPTSKSTTAQVDEGCGMMEARSHVDAKLAQLHTDIGGFRMSEDAAFIEGMNQLQATTMFYGNPANDIKEYLGLSTRYGLKSGGNAQNIIDAGGTGTDNTSVWLIVWSDQTVFCTFPKSSTAGLQHKDLGEESVQDANGGWYQALRTLYQWDNGLVVKDWRYAVRICNIDVSILTGEEAGTADLIKFMIKAIARIPALKMGRPAFYMNRTVKEMLEIQGLGKSTAASGVVNNVVLDDMGKLSQTISTFRGIPLRTCDQLLNTEARVV